MIKIRLIFALLSVSLGVSAQTNWNAFGLRYRVSGSDTTWYFPSNTVPVKNMSFYSRIQADGKFASLSALNGYVKLNPSSQQSGSIDIGGGINSFGLTTRNALTFDNNTSGGTAQSILYRHSGGFDVFGYNSTTRGLTWNRPFSLGSLNIANAPVTATNTTQVLTRNPTTGDLETVNSSAFVTATPTLQQVLTAGSNSTLGATFGGNVSVGFPGYSNSVLSLKSNPIAVYPLSLVNRNSTANGVWDFYVDATAINDERLALVNRNTGNGLFVDLNGSVSATGIPSQPNNVLRLAERGVANGVASLDGSGRVPLSQLPTGTQTYVGTWNASTNTPTLANGSGTTGQYYIVNTPGTQNLGSGSITFALGDNIIYNGSIWQKVANSSGVTSVNGQTATVVLTTSDINEGSNKYYTEGRVSSNPDVSANTSARHNAVTLGVANGLSLAGQQLSLSAASSTAIGALSATDWNTFNNKENSFSKNTAFNKDFGTAAGTVAEGNDIRINNGQTSFGWGNHAGLYPTYNGTGASGTWNISVAGNAGSVTNGVYTNGSYANPNWITSLAYSKITGVPTPSIPNLNQVLTAGATSPLGANFGGGVSVGFGSAGFTDAVLSLKSNSTMPYPLSITNRNATANGRWNLYVDAAAIDDEKLAIVNSLTGNGIFMQPNGNVAIGKTIADTKLDVNGSIRALPDAGTSNAVTVNSQLSGYALASSVPTQTSQLTNNSGFITSSALTGYATQAYADGKVQNSLNPSTTVAPSATAVNGALAQYVSLSTNQAILARKDFEAGIRRNSANDNNPNTVVTNTELDALKPTIDEEVTETQTNATLNGRFSTVGVGKFVIYPNVGTGMMYIKTSTSGGGTWRAVSMTAL